eukprot:410917_1
MVSIQQHLVYCFAVFDLLLWCVAADADRVYVSSTGTDSSQCGYNLEQACGTMYSATHPRNIHNVYTEIYIYDGQNEEQVKKYFVTNESYIWNPCLPHPNATSITITFNRKHIQKMNDWFNRDVCYYNYYKIQYHNTHLFKGKQMFLNNLYVDQINTDILPFSLLHFDVLISCIGCVFNNIYYNLDAPIINVDGEVILIRLINTTFINVHSSAYLLDASMVTWFNLFGFPSNIRIDNVSIYNSTFKSTIYNIYQYVLSLDRVFVSFSRCHFSYITTEQSIFTFNTTTNGALIVDVTDTVFEHILQGSIYTASYDPSCICDIEGSVKQLPIHFNNIFVLSSQISSHNRNFLFGFGNEDIITITNINVMYYYDIAANCIYFPEISEYKCNNPLPLIHNEGYVRIDGNNSFNATIINDDLMTDSTLFNYISDNMHLVWNHGTLHVENLKIHSSNFGPIIFGGDGILNIIKVEMYISVLSVNNLQPNSIILFNGTNLFINNCILAGGRDSIIQLFFSGVVEITNTTFKDSTAALLSYGNDEFVMNQSKLYNVGCLYVPNSVCNCASDKGYPFDFNWSGNVSLFSNVFSYYPYCGFSIFLLTQHLLLQNNIYIINHTNIDSVKFRYYRLINIMSCQISSTFLNNQFMNNTRVDVHVAWLHYDYNNAVNCISGNIMDNNAITLAFTNLTSCIRPELLNCFNDEDLCSDGVYGKINKEMAKTSNPQSIFIINENIPTVWNVDKYSFMALDAVTIGNHSVKINEGNILLLDSYLISNDSSADIWYLNSSCDVICNDRLENSKHIAKLVIICNDDRTVNTQMNSTWTRSLDSSTTKTVLHFSASMLYFDSTENQYSPGFSLYFTYSIRDIFDNVIANFNIMDHIDVVISNSDLSVLMGFYIDEYGCGLCDDGITIFGANLLNQFGQSYKIHIDLQYEYLLLKNEHIHLNIIGCPVAYGATSNKHQCEKCPTDRYNLIANNTKECKLCDKNSKKILQCKDYFDNM